MLYACRFAEAALAYDAHYTSIVETAWRTTGDHARAFQYAPSPAGSAAPSASSPAVAAAQAAQAAIAEALAVAGRTVINTPTPAAAAEALARYCDVTLRRGARGVAAANAAPEDDGGDGSSDAELNRRLAAAARLFTYLTEEDMFANFHTRFLAKRLLQGSSASIEVKGCRLFCV